MNSKGQRKNLLRSTSNKPLRLALLGPHSSSKTAILSIVSDEKSPINYYPTTQNSPMLNQMIIKSPKARALLDIYATADNLEEIGVLGNHEFSLPERVLHAVEQQEDLSVSGKDTKGYGTTAAVLKYTSSNYDLDYTVAPKDLPWTTDSPTSRSPMASFSYGSSCGASNNMTPLAGRLVSEPLSATTSPHYNPPVATPLLVELIDTPGVQREELIPFLEKGLDSKLASDVLQNLLNEASSENRSSVRPLITGSGMSDLNAAMDGYLFCYSCVPESSDTAAPPSYDAAMSDGLPMASDFEALEILRALYNSIVDAWKMYLNYHRGWEMGQEFDVYSLNYSFQHLWKKMAIQNSAKVDDATLELRAKKVMPPILVVCTHIDHELASPVLMEEGRKFAKEIGAGFVEVSCEFDNWRNVEEAFSVIIRDRIEQKRLSSPSK